MDKLTEYYLKVDNWIKQNPKKAAVVIGIFVAFVLGALIF